MPDMGTHPNAEGAWLTEDVHCGECGYSICNCTAKRTVAEILAPPPEPEHDPATCAVCKTIDRRAMAVGMPVLERVKLATNLPTPDMMGRLEQYASTRSLSLQFRPNPDDSICVTFMRIGYGGTFDCTYEQAIRYAKDGFSVPLECLSK